MKQFSKIILESKDTFDPKELEMGIEIESEHGDIYEMLDNYLESFNIRMPWDKKEFYQKIAESHLREIPDYYTRLNKMEKESNL